MSANDGTNGNEERGMALAEAAGGELTLPPGNVIEQTQSLEMLRDRGDLFRPRNWSELIQFAEYVCKSEVVPKGFRGKAADIVVAVQMGAELGLAPMQSLQNVAVINGRPSLWGDAIPGLIFASGKCEWFRESTDQEIKATGRAWSQWKRFGNPEPLLREFTREDAATANLLGKEGPWQQYPVRMLRMRARGFAVRDLFADVLKGLSISEEAEDFPREAMPARPTFEAPRSLSGASAPASAPALAAGPDGMQLARVVEVEKGPKAWFVKLEDGRKLSTFKPEQADIASSALRTTDGWVRISTKTSGAYTNIVEIDLASREPGAEG